MEICEDGFMRGGIMETSEPTCCRRDSADRTVDDASGDGYEASVIAVLERGGSELAEGRLIGLDEFLTRHKDDADG